MSFPPSPPSSPLSGPLVLRRGATVARRYELAVALGRGAYGEVWTARDTLTAETVAIKVLRPEELHEPARIRREVSALRSLRLPGVVRLVDEGIDRGRPYLVMEVVEGTPFPGLPTPCPWETIAARTTALLEAVARIHAAGIVHRDLKPANVLVGPSGAPTILDFGLSRGRGLGEDLTREGDLLGTPVFLAPELLAGETATLRSDLYAIGVMLYLALGGRLPHPGDVHAALAARTFQPALPLRDVCPEAPAPVARLVDSLLERKPTDRPRSAADALALLRGQSTPPPAEGAFPRLGGTSIPDAIVRAVNEGRSLRVVGPRGSGRTRNLQEAAARLAEEGWEVLWLAPGRSPFSSLESALGDHALTASTPLAEARRSFVQRLRERLRGKTALFVDDLETQDRWSGTAVEALAGEGRVVRSALTAGDDPTATLVEPLSEAALMGLFSGEDRLFHVPEDAGSELAARTEGLPGRVVEEVQAWVRAGLATWNGHQLAIDRESIDRLRTGLGTTVPSPTRGDTRASVTPRTALWPAYADELLDWVSLASPHAEPTRVATAMGQPLWRVEAELEALIERGAVRRRGPFFLAPGVTPRWEPDGIRAAHRALAAATAPGGAGRLVHLLFSAEEASPADSLALMEEARLVARHLAREGTLGKATLALDSALGAVRRATTTTPQVEALVTEVLSDWTVLALREGTPLALDRVLYELSRSETPTPQLSALQQLARAGLLAEHGAPGAALTRLEAMEPFESLALERQRQRLRVLAARRLPIERHEATVASALAWAAGHTDDATRALADAGLARLRYRQGRYAEASALHFSAARLESWVSAQLRETMRAAASLMECFEPREAARIADTARALARRSRNPLDEAECEWLVRCAGYRAHTVTLPDLALVKAVEQLATPDLEALICLNEGTIAWRAGLSELATSLSGRAAHLWATLGKSGSVLLARSLQIASGSPATAAEREALASQALECAIPGVGLQVLGLLAAEGPPDVPARAVVPLAAEVPEAHWSERIDVLSVHEALVRLGLTTEGFPPRGLDDLRALVETRTPTGSSGAPPW